MAVALFFLVASALLGAASAQQQSLGDIKSITCSGSECNITALVGISSTDTVPLRLVFYSPSIVRWWLALDGNFSDTGAADDVIVGQAQPGVVSLRDAGSYYEVSQPGSSSNVTAQLLKSPLLLSLLVDGELVFQESWPLSWTAYMTWQTPARDVAPLPDGLTKEWFFGGGMQNGRFSHRDESISIAVSYDWDDGGNSNAVPWYMSSAGYGVFRNTWAPGEYIFHDPVFTAHNETNRFDAFIMLAGPGPNSMKTLLGLYTYLTGPPFLPPLYALFLGDSDCYHNDRHGNSTQVAIAVGDMYRTFDMPNGWLLVNDGYGCGVGENNDGPFPSNLTDLTYVIEELHATGAFTGLWTSTGMPNIKQEVGIAGSRVCKTDVGWIGAGYQYAFEGVTLCANGIEEYSTPPARRFVWTVEGWAGTHRLAVMWTGDNSGSMDYVRWQLPTFIGSGLSAQAHVSGDVDGIFGGSPESYVRDLQFKALMTTPWAWGEPFTTYNRASLKLKAQLTPYVYSLCRIAYDTGVPPVRASLLEFPADERLYEPNTTSTAGYQFMTGPWLLVAPVYVQGAVTRDGIVLPAGAQWVDWWNGTLWAGNQTLDGYAAPLSVLPLFVRAGAIVPMWPAVDYFNATPANPMRLELWPAGNTSFTLYEDDGVTREALPPSAAFATTAISVSAPSNYLSTPTAAGNVTISVGAAVGTFDGQLASRAWRLAIRSPTPPLQVLFESGGSAVPLPQMQSDSQLERSGAGWFFNPYLQAGIGGLLTVKLPSLPATAAFVVTLSNGPAFPRIGTEACDTPLHHQVENQKFSFDNATGQILVEPPADPPLCLTVGQDEDPESHTHAVEVQPCAAALAAAQTFSVVAASGQIALRSDASQCLDQDVSDLRVIEYGCHDPASPGNQAWAINPDGASQHIVSVENGLCMSVFPPP